MSATLHVNLHKLARFFNTSLLAFPLVFFVAGQWLSFYFHFLTVASLFFLIVNYFYRHVQTQHAVLRNFGIIGQGRYLIESLGPEFRQYLFSGDREERPFNRLERQSIYRKSKNIDSAVSFGSLLEYDSAEIKLCHSLFPTPDSLRHPYSVTFGKERGVDEPYTIDKPMIVSAMSYGALGSNAVRALARGASMAGIPMNTGEGGYPKYHLMEDADLIFQMGTAKFGVRTKDGFLDERALIDLSTRPQIKMIEIKFSQGAKPGKGGLLPREKITAEIADLRGIQMERDAISPPYHSECADLPSTVAFIERIQSLVPIPVGIKMCVGSLLDVRGFIDEMERQDVFPDWITIDGGEGGTGAAPGAFIDWVGMPLWPSLYGVASVLDEKGLRGRTKLLAAGKLVDAGRQAIAFALGADAVYTARGFMFAMGCIQARECGNNTCPVGITTHDPSLQAGLAPEVKSVRVKHYVVNTLHELDELTIAMGKSCPTQITLENLYVPTGSNLWQMISSDPALRERLETDSAKPGARNISHPSHEEGAL